MGEYILAHDLGTSGNKAALYTLDGRLACSMVAEYPTYYPFEGAVEQDAQDWWRAVCESTKALLEKAGIRPGEIMGVSLSGIMMGCLLVDKECRPLHNMLIWADTRSAAQEKRMLRQVDLRRAYRITGHRPSASYPAAKLLWIKDNLPDIYAAAHKMIHAKDYIVAQLTGRIATDYSDASGTNLLDLERRQWSDELLSGWDIRRDLLPELLASTEVAGGVSRAGAAQSGLMEGTPVVMGGGDGSCATVGAGVTAPGNAYNVIGTSSWISMASDAPYYDDEMRTFNWIHLDKTLYTPCGTMQAAGFSYSWYRDVLGGLETALAKERNVSAYSILDSQLAQSLPGAGGLLYLPYLLGERSPHWNHKARGAFIGMSASTSKADFTRAVLEGVGCNLKIILSALEQYAPIPEITVIGGGAKSRQWMQILSDIWQKPVKAPVYLEEATSMGAAVCAGVGIGAYPDFSVAHRFNAAAEYIQPRAENAQVYRGLFKAFCLAYRQLEPVYDSMAELRRQEGDTV